MMWSPPMESGVTPAWCEMADIASIRAQRILHVDRVDRHVADIGADAEIVGRDERAVIHEPHQRRRLADLARAEPRAGPVGGRSVEGNAEESDVDLARRLFGRDMRQAHEGRDAGKARHDHAGKGLVGLEALRAPASATVCCVFAVTVIVWFFPVNGPRGRRRVRRAPSPSRSPRG